MILDNDTELKRVVELGSDQTWPHYSFSGVWSLQWNVAINYMASGDHVGLLGGKQQIGADIKSIQTVVYLS